jgi:Mg2+ and Co2+ transporter CorA
LSVDKYIETIRKKIESIEEALNKVNDIRTFSINKSLDEIGETRMCTMSKDSINDSQELIDMVRADAEEAARRINARIQGIHASVCKTVQIIAPVSGIGTRGPDGEQQLIEIHPE